MVGRSGRRATLAEAVLVCALSVAALRVEITPATWSAPVSNAPVAIVFKQLVKATDALRTGAYSKTLTFTLSTTTP
jgi:hypothetical protein